MYSYTHKLICQIQLLKSVYIGLAKKFICFFFHKMAVVVFYFIQNNFVRLYCDSGRISVHLKKRTKLVNFCVTILILKMEENMQHIQHVMLYYF